MTAKVLISIVGPTAIGKTKLAIALAQHYHTEIISADSRQFYKEMSIGTAVPSKDELKTVKHHFIQHKSIFDPYSVGSFEKDAISRIEELFKEKDMLVMVGGSGLYVDAVTKGLDEFPKIDPHIRLTLNQRLEKEGKPALQQQLKKLDKAYYSKVDLENPHRLVRALEICLGTGKTYSSFLTQKPKNRSFTSLQIGMVADRKIMYDRIDQRVDLMMGTGLLEEAKSLKAYKKLNALQTVGYRELFNYLDGDWTLDFAISEIKKNTRRFAKRQLTWFKKNEAIFWFDFDASIEKVIDFIETRRFQTN